MYGNEKNIFVQDYQFVLADALLASCSDDKQEDEHFTIGELSCAYEQVVPHTVFQFPTKIDLLEYLGT